MLPSSPIRLLSVLASANPFRMNVCVTRGGGVGVAHIAGRTPIVGLRRFLLNSAPANPFESQRSKTNNLNSSVFTSFHKNARGVHSVKLSTGRLLEPGPDVRPVVGLVDAPIWKGRAEGLQTVLGTQGLLACRRALISAGDVSVCPVKQRLRRAMRAASSFPHEP